MAGRSREKQGHGLHEEHLCVTGKNVKSKHGAGDETFDDHCARCAAPLHGSPFDPPCYDCTTREIRKRYISITCFRRGVCLFRKKKKKKDFIYCWKAVVKKKKKRLYSAYIPLQYLFF